MLKTFAHRGGMAHAPQNTLEAFRRAMAHGATGVETDAFLTRDGVVVLAHDPVVARRPGSVERLRDLTRDALPPHVPTLDQLLDVVGPSTDLFVDVKDDAALPVLAETLLRRRDPGDLRVWLAHAGYLESDRQLVASWADVLPGAQLVDSTSLTRMPDGPAAHLAQLAAGPLRWLNLPIAEWTPELVAACRRAGLAPMAFGVHDAQRMERAVALGLAAVHGDDVDVMVEVVGHRAA